MRRILGTITLLGIVTLAGVALVSPARAVEDTPGQTGHEAEDCIEIPAKAPKVKAKSRIGGENISVPLTPAARGGSQAPEDVTIKVRRPDGTEKAMTVPTCPVE